MENYFHPELRGSSSEKPSRARGQVTKFQRQCDEKTIADFSKTSHGKDWSSVM